MEQDLIELAWHQREAQRRRSFAYVVMRPDDRVQLGCVYIVLSEKQGSDAAAAEHTPVAAGSLRVPFPRVWPPAAPTRAGAAEPQ